HPSIIPANRSPRKLGASATVSNRAEVMPQRCALSCRQSDCKMQDRLAGRIAFCRRIPHCDAIRRSVDRRGAVLASLRSMSEPAPSLPPPGPRPNAVQRFKRFLLGRPKDLQDPHLFRHISLVAFLAWVGLGADG